MATHKQKEDLAHAIWEYEGHPEGKDKEHWRRAEQMLEITETYHALVIELARTRQPLPPHADLSDIRSTLARMDVRGRRAWWAPVLSFGLGMVIASYPSYGNLFYLGMAIILISIFEMVIVRKKDKDYTVVSTKTMQSPTPYDFMCEFRKAELSARAASPSLIRSVITHTSRLHALSIRNKITGKVVNFPLDKTSCRSYTFKRACCCW